jgi:hypothetical protein
VIAAARLDDETINPTPAAVTEDAEDAKPPVPAAVRYVPDPARVRHAEPQRSGVARIHPQRLGV